MPLLERAGTHGGRGGVAAGSGSGCGETRGALMALGAGVRSEAPRRRLRVLSAALILERPAHSRAPTWFPRTRLTGIQRAGATRKRKQGACLASVAACPCTVSATGHRPFGARQRHGGARGRAGGKADALRHGPLPGSPLRLALFQQLHPGWPCRKSCFCVPSPLLLTYEHMDLDKSPVPQVRTDALGSNDAAGGPLPVDNAAASLGSLGGAGTPGRCLRAGGRCQQSSSLRWSSQSTAALHPGSARCVSPCFTLRGSLARKGRAGSRVFLPSCIPR